MKLDSVRGNPFAPSQRIETLDVSRNRQKEVEAGADPAAQEESAPSSTVREPTTETHLHGEIVRSQLRHGAPNFAPTSTGHALGSGGNPQTTAPKPTKPDLFPQDVLERTAVEPQENVSASRSSEAKIAAARMPYEELPTKLKETLKKSFAHPDQFWAGLGNSQRQTLATTFNRLDEMELWHHVAKVTGEHKGGQPEKPVAGVAKVPGQAGEIGFETNNPKAFINDLLELERKRGSDVDVTARKGGKYGKDPAYAAVFHSGQTSLREHNPTDGSLHIAVGPGRNFDTHLDQVSAVDAPDPDSHNAVPNLGRAMKHNATEVAPQFIRKYSPGGFLPGVVVGSGSGFAVDTSRLLDPTGGRERFPVHQKGDDPQVSANMTFQLAPKEDRIQLEREKDTAIVDDEVLRNAIKAGTNVATADQLRRKDIQRDDPRYQNAAIPGKIAGSLAGHITNAAREGRIMAEFNLPSYYRNLSTPERRALTDTLGRISRAVMTQLPPEVRESVHSLKISFGDRNEYIPLRD